MKLDRIFEPTELVESAATAAKAVERAACPVAIKLLSRHITHKSDAGGVVLDVATSDHARAAFAAITAGAHRYARARKLPQEAYAATVTPMLAQPVTELLIGAYRDPQLGPVLTIGAGGIRVEVLRDVTHRVLPVDPGELEAMLAELKVSALLAGGRGRPPVPMRGIVAAAAFMTVLLVAACGLFGPSESHEDGEEEESGTQLTKSQTYDEVRNGCRLILRYDAATNAFTGTAQNVTNGTLSRVRVEVHLSNGIELGPTTPVNLAPDESADIFLRASTQSFETWSAHPEVG